VFALLTLCALQSGTPLLPGHALTRSCVLKSAIYEIGPSADQQVDRPNSGVIHVRGSGITIDFNGATLVGSLDTTEPNMRAGVGMDVSGPNITIKNAHIRGYKVGLIARHCPHLKLINCDFSYNWKQRLGSTLEREDEADWQSYHHNENDEWLRYGAGAYIEDSNGFEVRGCKVTGGQCGVMLVRSNRGKVWNSNCSFLSGVGLGLYRSSDNVVEHNRFDWCVRGYSYGVYNRGQDSAGILVFEQCNDNQFAYNSVTHGGDGFFLWAGQHTMDTGAGGCNNNVLYGNDFSHAVANGIEATFSKNTFANNLLVECDYGIWGGYSYDTAITDNYVAASRVGMAFEHSQNCDFSLNRFARCKTGIMLWGGGKIDPTWGYAKKRDVRAMKNSLSFNKFADVPGPAISLQQTLKTTITENTAYGATQGIVADASSGPIPAKGLERESELVDPLDWSKAKEYSGDITELVDGWDPYHSDPFNAYRVPVLKGGISPFLPARALRGRAYILVDKWGPYDFRYPRLWPREEGKPGQRVLEVLGPKGSWKVASVQGGVVVGASSGSVPGILTIKSTGAGAADVVVSVVFRGGEATDYRGVVTKPQTPITISYSEFVATLDWNVKFFKWNDATDPRTQPAAFDALIHGPAEASERRSKLNYAGGDEWIKGVGGNKFAVEAETDFSPTSPGDFKLDLISDDGCRVFLDDQPIQLVDDSEKPADGFKYQGPTHYTAPLHLTAGKHRIGVDYFQIDGYKTLVVNLTRAARQ
jgi:hypothetical protein